MLRKLSYLERMEDLLIEPLIWKFSSSNDSLRKALFELQNMPEDFILTGSMASNNPHPADIDFFVKRSVSLEERLEQLGWRTFFTYFSPYPDDPSVAVVYRKNTGSTHVDVQLIHQIMFNEKKVLMYQMHRLFRVHGFSKQQRTAILQAAMNSLLLNDSYPRPSIYPR
jgi:hypothetical protein